MSWFLDMISKAYAAAIKQDPMILIGKAVVAEAERLWNLDVYDPKIGDKSERAGFCLKIINDVIHAGGWTWIKYLGDGPPQWCGLFAAACWRAAGIDPKWLATFWASTARLDNWAKDEGWQNQGQPFTPSGGKRPFIALTGSSIPEDCVFPDGTLPRAGDIVVVGDEAPKEGDHICIVVSFDPVTGVFKTISGNGGGVGPKGNKRQGISKADYRVGGSKGGFYVIRVYRPLTTDMAKS